jgi:hypothetical protein
MRRVKMAYKPKMVNTTKRVLSIGSHSAPRPIRPVTAATPLKPMVPDNHKKNIAAAMDKIKSMFNKRKKAV